MSSYFKRTYSLLAGKRGSETALKIGDSRIQFSIKKTNKKSNNTAEIRIFNVSKTTASVFGDDKTIVTLVAGYEQGAGTGVVYSGDVSDIRTERSGADIVTVLELSEGSTIIRETAVSFSMSGVVNPVDMINKIASSIGMPTSITTGKIRFYQSGFTAFGAPLDAIAKICRKINCSYSVESGVLNIWESVDGKKDVVVSLSPKTGLIGIPQKIKIDDKNGWSVTSLLNPNAMPGARVSVSSKTVSGNLTMVNVTHDGDSHGGEWITTMEGQIVS